MKITRITIALVGIIALCSLYAGSWNNAPWQTDNTVIRGDGQAFYAWLPAACIHHDLSFRFYQDSALHISEYFSERFLYPHARGQVLKTPCGVAVMVLPFFAANLGVRSLAGHSSSGYEPSFQRALGLAAWCYLLAGLWCMAMVMRRFVGADSWIALTLATTAMGTNLWYYALFHPAMSHVYSFFLVAACCLLWQKWEESGKNYWLLLLAAALGLVYLVRPVNLAVIAFFPVLSGGSGFLRNAQVLLSRWKWLLCATILFCLVAAMQHALNYAQCGDAFAWTYKHEGFDFLRARIGSVWWSFNKGFFVYVPVALLALGGVFWWSHSHKPWFIAFFFLLSWLTASWWNWNYGSGFGMRPLVDFYACLFLPLALWSRAPKWGQWVIFMLIVAAVGLCQLQTWQFNHRIIHPEEMDANKYRHVWLRTDDSAVDCLGGGNELPLGAISDSPLFTRATSFGRQDSLWHSLIAATVSTSEGETEAMGLLNDTILFNASIYLPVLPAMRSETWMLYLRTDRLEATPDAAGRAVWVCTYQDSEGKTTWYNKLRINDYPRKESNQWESFRYQLRMPAMKAGRDEKCLVYIYNPEGKTFLVDNIHIAGHSYDWQR